MWMQRRRILKLKVNGTYLCGRRLRGCACTCRALTIQIPAESTSIWQELIWAMCTGNGFDVD